MLLHHRCAAYGRVEQTGAGQVNVPGHTAYFELRMPRIAAPQWKRNVSRQVGSADRRYRFSSRHQSFVRLVRPLLLVSSLLVWDLSGRFATRDDSRGAVSNFILKATSTARRATSGYQR
jgi:hypothetical protein